MVQELNHGSASDRAGRKAKPVAPGGRNRGEFHASINKGLERLLKKGG